MSGHAACGAGLGNLWSFITSRPGLEAPCIRSRASPCAAAHITSSLPVSTSERNRWSASGGDRNLGGTRHDELALKPVGADPGSGPDVKYRLISNDLIGTSSAIRRPTIGSHRELILNGFEADGTISDGIVGGLTNTLKVTFRRAEGPTATSS